MNSATETMKLRSILQNTAAVAVFVAGLCTQVLTASAQSFLDEASSGMTQCVNHILNGRGAIRKVDVHGHQFNCRRMAAKSNARGNFRQILLERSRFGLDDAYVVNFRVDGRNMIVPGTLRIRTTNGFSTRTLLAAWHVSILATNTAIANFAARYDTHTRGFPGPSAYRFMSYEQVADLARAVPPVETKKWETAAFEVALITIAEHGRSSPRPPRVTAAKTHLQRETDLP